MYDSSNQYAKGGANLCGKITVTTCFHPTDNDEAETMVVMMDDVVRQDDSDYLRTASNMRNGTTTDPDVQFIMNRKLDTLPNHNILNFDNTIHLISEHKMAHGITAKYLTKLLTPLAKYKVKRTGRRPNGISCIKNETSLPLKLAMCTGAIVMLLTNYITEVDLMNGSVGTIFDICSPNQGSCDSKDKSHLDQGVFCLAGKKSS